MKVSSVGRIYLSSPHMGGGEMRYIKEAFDTNWVAPLGVNVDGFERELQAFTGTRYAAALTSGTTALHLALIILGVEPGDVVICQSMTFSASANPKEVLPSRIERRREINHWYRNLLAHVPGITFQSEPGTDFYSNFWLTAITITITIDPSRAGVDREVVRLRLLEENIESRPLWKPMHIQPVFKDAPAFVNGISETLFERGLCLPSGSNMTEADMGRIEKTLMGIFVRRG